MPLEWGSRHHARLDAWNRGMAEGMAWLDTHTGLKVQTNREFVHPIYWKVIVVLFFRDLSSYNISIYIPSNNNHLYLGNIYPMVLWRKEHLITYLLVPKPLQG